MHVSPRVASWLFPSPPAPEPAFSFNIQATRLVLPFQWWLEFQALPSPPCLVPGNPAVTLLPI